MYMYLLTWLHHTVYHTVRILGARYRGVCLRQLEWCVTAAVSAVLGEGGAGGGRGCQEQRLAGLHD